MMKRTAPLLASMVALASLVAVSAPTVLRSQAAQATSGFSTVGLVDPSQGRWHLRNAAGNVTSFFFGNPGDLPIMGDWDCDGVDTPGMYRQADGFVYLSNANRSQVADIRFFFGNPGDVPLAGDFDADGCDTVSIYRPTTGRFFIINKLGANEGGLGAAETDYLFGNPGDKPFVGDFNGDGAETVGLHRESTGLVYFRQSHTQGAADAQFIFGDPGDRLVAGDWNHNGADSPALFRPSSTTFFFRNTNTQGVADHQFQWGEGNWLPVAGEFGLDTAPPPTSTTSTTTTMPQATTWTTRTLDSDGVVGEYASLAIGSDGLPIVAYYDRSHTDLKVAHCQDINCESVSYVWPDFSGSVGQFTSIAIGLDGYPVISYEADNDLALVHCNDRSCTSSDKTVLDPGFGLEPGQVAIGSDGNPIVSYHDGFPPASVGTDGVLMVAHCQDPLCASVITTIVDGLTAPADVGDYSSIAIGVDGLPVIAYHDRRSNDLRVAHCEDLGCTNATVTVVDNGEGRGIFTDIAIGSDGFPVIVYNANAFSGGGLRVAHCTNVACTSSTNIRVDALGSYNMSVAIDSDGFPLISRRSIFNDEVSVIDCADVACNSSVKTEVGFSAAPICCGGYTSIAVDPSGRAFVIYSEDLFAELRFAVRS